MNKFKLPVVFAATLLAVATSSMVLADDQPGTGVLKGIVLSSSGSPLASVSIRLYVDQELETGGSTGAQKGKSIGFYPSPSFLAKGKLVRTVVTDAKGKFEAKSLKPGAYTYRVGDPTSIGYKYGRVQVDSGKTTEVEVKLDPPVKR